ncbi:MAG: hypothetical protein MHPSP_002920, partial [Paramarteilia canceri]
VGLRFICNRKRGIQIHYLGYMYNKHLSEDTWRCSKRSHGCGLAKYQNGIFSETNSHVCKPNVGSSNSKIASFELVETARTSTQTTSQIVRENLSKLDDGKKVEIFCNYPF